MAPAEFRLRIVMVRCLCGHSFSILSQRKMRKRWYDTAAAFILVSFQIERPEKCHGLILECDKSIRKQVGPTGMGALPNSTVERCIQI